MSLEAEADYDLGEEINLGSNAAKSVKNRRKCSICGESVCGHVSRHTLGCHLPWYFDPTSACWQCHRYVKGKLSRHVEGSGKAHSDHLFSDYHLELWCRLMFAVLIFLANHLELDSVADLLLFVVSHQLFSEHNSNDVPFDSEQVRYRQKICQLFGLTIPETLAISPPNHVVSILHWKTLVKILQSFKNVGIYMSEFRSFSFPIPVTFIRQPPGHVSFIDSHCHLDTIMTTLNYRKFSQLKADLSVGEPVLQLCISNFVFPWRWFTIDRLLGISPLVYGTIGVHPHAVTLGKEQEQVSKVADHLNGGKFIGVGEVGLEFQNECKCKPVCRNAEACLKRKKESQRLFLRGVLPLADQHNLALVLHCRDDGDGAAAKEVKLLLKELALTHLPIHRHCFIGSVKEMRDWLNTFPNVMFGLTLKSLDKMDAAFLSELKLQKILLETDSPYFRKHATNSWQVHCVARKLSTLKNIPLSVLVDVCNANARKLYGL